MGAKRLKGSARVRRAERGGLIAVGVELDHGMFPFITGDKPPTVSDLAAHLHISEGYLHRIFKKSLHCTPLAYINKRRISTLIDPVKNKNLTLREAACNVGLDDPAYSSRLFQKVMGVCFHDFWAMEIR